MTNDGKEFMTSYSSPMREDVRLLLENGFRNIDLPRLGPEDIGDIAGALDAIYRERTRQFRERDHAPSNARRAS